MESKRHGHYSKSEGSESVHTLVPKSQYAVATLLTSVVKSVESDVKLYLKRTS